MTGRRRDRDTIYFALIDAIGWQNGLVDAYSATPDDPVRADAIAQEAEYRSLLKRRYGDDRTPQEIALAAQTTDPISALEAACKEISDAR